MQQQSLFKHLAPYYDLIYSWKDYKKETERLIHLLRRYKKSRGNQLLEVACGTGNYLQYLHKRYSCTGIDLHPEVLRIARKKLSRIPLLTADMTHFHLHRTFDIILCLFSSLGYVKTSARLRNTIHCFTRHLNPGGVLVIEPWLTPSTYKPGFPHMSTYTSPELKIARLSISKKKGNLSIDDMHYLVAARDKNMQYFIDQHVMGLFETKQILHLMQEAGLQTSFLKQGLMKGRGLLIGVKK